MGFPITTRSMGELLDECVALLARRQLHASPVHVACADPHALMLALADERFASALRGAWRLFPDGAGIVLASRLFGERRIHARITGPDFFEASSNRLDGTASSASYFFLGTTDQTLQRIERRMRDRYPHIPVAGTFAPPFRDRFDAQESAAMVSAVNRSGATVLGGWYDGAQAGDLDAGACR